MFLNSSCSHAIKLFLCLSKEITERKDSQWKFLCVSNFTYTANCNKSNLTQMFVQ